MGTKEKLRRFMFFVLFLVLFVYLIALFYLSLIFLKVSFGGHCRDEGMKGTGS